MPQSVKVSKVDLGRKLSIVTNTDSHSRPLFSGLQNITSKSAIELLPVYFTENRSEFLEKLEKARSSVGSEPPQPILSKPGSATVNVGNWCLISKKDGELRIVNTDGQQVSLCFNTTPSSYYSSCR